MGKSMRYPKVRDVLNKIRWTGSLSDYRLVVKDRISGTKIVECATITRIGKKDFDSGDATIPFYKVLTILHYDDHGIPVWQRPTEGLNSGDALLVARKRA